MPVVNQDPAPPDPAPARFKVVLLRISKGDVAFEETVGVFATEAEAMAFRDHKLQDPATTPRWPDFDEYEVRPLEP